MQSRLSAFVVSLSPPRRFDRSNVLVAFLLILTVLLVAPPFVFLFDAAFTVNLPRAGAVHGLRNFLSAWDASGLLVWWNTALYALGASILSVLLGAVSAWLVARTDAPFRRLAIGSAFLSMSAPVIVKGIGWILLLGPNKGALNEGMRALGFSGLPITLFSLQGMILIEAIVWMPVVFLILLPAFYNLDQRMEEAARMSGAGAVQTAIKVILPSTLPALFAVLLFTGVRTLESFDVPLLIGSPGRVDTITTIIFDTIHAGLRPNYGEASAYSLVLMAAMVLPLLYSRSLTRNATRFGSIDGKGYRPATARLGKWRFVAGAYLLLLPIFLVLPIAILVWAALLPTYEAPSLALLSKLTLRNFRALAVNTQVIEGFSNGILVALGAATFTVLLTFTSAWLILRRQGAWNWILEVAMSAPLVFPGVVLSTGLLIAALQLPFLSLYGSLMLIGIAFTIKALPYGLRFGQSATAAIHLELEEAAHSSGAAAGALVRRILLPLLVPGLLSAWIYTFLSSIRDLSVPAILSGPRNPVVAGVLLDLWHDGSLPMAAAASVLLMLAAALLGGTLLLLASRFGLKHL